MINLWAIERHKLFKRSAFWIASTVLMLFIAAMVIVVHLASGVVTSQETAGASFPGMLWPYGLVTVLNEFASPGFGGGIVTIVLASALLAKEFDWGTIQLALTRGASRIKLLGAKFMALVFAVFLIVIASVIVGGATTGLITYVSKGTLHAEQIVLTQVAASILRSFAAMLPMAALCTLIGIKTRSTAGTLGGALGYLILGEQMLATILGLAGAPILGAYLPLNLATFLVLYNGSLVRGFVAPDLPVSAARALVGILFWTAVFFGLAVWIFRRQDLST